MQYQSIIRLFNYCDIDCNTMDAGKIKKILSAEFAIAPNGIVSVDNFDYTKNDIFLELEGDDFEQRLRYHQLIWEHPYLLQCLERNTVDFYNVYTWVKLQHDKQFVSFISPYFAESFDKIMRKLLNPANFDDAGRWLRLLVFIDNPDDEDRALSGIRIFISEFIRLLKNSNDITYHDIIPQLDGWIDQSSYLFINELPDSLYKLKDDLARAMVNFTVKIQHANKNLCYEISSILVRFYNLEPSLYELIQDNHKIYKSKVGKDYSRQDSDSGGWKSIFIIIPVLIGILRICSHSGSSNSYNNTYSSFSERKEITLEYYENLKEQFAVIDTSKYAGFINKEMLLIHNMPYYMIFESPNKKDSICVNIVNNGSVPITLYLETSDEIIFDIGVTPGEKVSVKSSTNSLDMLLSNAGQSAMTLRPRPIYISKELDLEYHTINLKEKRTLYLDDAVPDKENIITMEVYKNTADHNFNCIRFVRAGWLQ